MLDDAGDGQETGPGSVCGVAGRFANDGTVVSCSVVRKVLD